MGKGVTLYLNLPKPTLVVGVPLISILGCILRTHEKLVIVAQRAQYPLIKEYSLNHNKKSYII